MSDLNLAMVDADGAVREAAESAGLDRSDFLKKGALAGGGLLVGSAMFSGVLSSAEAAISTTRKSATNDVKILNYALTLEFLEAAFYEQAVANRAYGSSDALKQFAEVVAVHERKHVNFLKGALGAKAIKSPTFDFGDTVTDTAKFAATAQVLEFLEAAFYEQAVANRAYGSDVQLKQFAEVVAVHERKHVNFLKGALGSKAIKSPTFDFGDTVTDPAKFAATAQVLEETGVNAYLGQVGNIRAKGTLAAAATITTVEARHAAWIRFINGDTPAPASFDKRKSERAILKAVGDTGFIQ